MGRCGWRPSELAGSAADEPDDFEMGAVADGGGRPIGLTDDAAVELDGDALGVDLQMIEQGGEGQAVGHGLSLSVYHNFDRVWGRNFFGKRLTPRFADHYSRKLSSRS